MRRLVVNIYGESLEKTITGHCHFVGYDWIELGVRTLAKH